ncbi:MAG: hypothetical protein R3B89_02625 [Polyangiaceae bacterium]
MAPPDEETKDDTETPRVDEDAPARDTEEADAAPRDAAGHRRQRCSLETSTSTSAIGRARRQGLP